MRLAFIDALTSIAETDDRVVLLTGDLGFRVLDKFADTHPQRFFNAGVAEANMIGMGAGMALRGLIPYCYSIATFASMRGYEQIRDDVALHRLPVRIVGVGGGFSYGSAGATHHAVEDVAIMRAVPGMTVVAPTDDAQTGAAVAALHNRAGPIYLRLSKDNTTVAEVGGDFTLGGVHTIGDGEVALITYGRVATNVLRARDELAAAGTAVRVVIAPTLAASPAKALAAALQGVNRVVTIEDHRIDGGLGSIVAEVIAESGLPCRLQRLGLGGAFPSPGGGEAYLHSQIGIDTTAIVSAVLSAPAKSRR